MITKYNLTNGKIRFAVDEYLGTDNRTGEIIRLRKRGFKTKKEAELFVSRTRYEYDQTGAKQDNQLIKFSEIYDLWLKQYKLTVKENTYIVHKMKADKHVLPNFEKYFVDKITVSHCQVVANDWYSYYAEATNLVSITNRILDLAVNLGYTRDNPMRRIIRPKNTHKKPYQSPFYSKQELLKFFEVIKDEDYMKRVLFRVLAYTGLRTAEILGLQWQDLDLRKGLLSVRRVVAVAEKGYNIQSPKTKNSARTIALDKNTIRILRQWQQKQRVDMLKLGYNTNKDDQFVFTNNKNQHLNTCYITTLLKRILKKHPELPHITAHGFRHTHCSLLFEAGASMKDVKDRLGHASIRTTMNIYAHVTEAQRDETADKFAKFMEG